MWYIMAYTLNINHVNIKGINMATQTKSKNLRIDITDLIAERIVTGFYKEGNLLPREVDLAKELNVGKSTVREALKGLSFCGFIQAVSGVGTQVRPCDEWNLLDEKVLKWLSVSDDWLEKLAVYVLDLREILEPHVAKLAATNAAPKNLLDIETALHNMKNNIGNIDEYNTQDARFHAAIFKATGNPLWNQLSYFMFSALTNALAMSNKELTEEDLQIAYGKHEQLYFSILNRNKKDAEKLSKILVTEAVDILKAHHL